MSSPAPDGEAAWTSARHGGTNMNTLIAVGTSIAYAYSAFVTLWPRLAMQWGFPQDLYFETGVIIERLRELSKARRSAIGEADQHPSK